MREDQTQLFKTDYDTRCDTFGCEDLGTYFIGRPDAPLNTSYLLCDKCTETVVESVKNLFDMHEKSVHAPKEDEVKEVVNAVDYELEEVLEAIKTHAQLDELIAEFKVEGVPNRDEEGGKLHERKDAVRKSFK